jgi:hypothetical protein
MDVVHAVVWLEHGEGLPLTTQTELRRFLRVMYEHCGIFAETEYTEVTHDKPRPQDLSPRADATVDGAVVFKKRRTAARALNCSIPDARHLGS